MTEKWSRGWISSSSLSHLSVFVVVSQMCLLLFSSVVVGLSVCPSPLLSVCSPSSRPRRRRPSDALSLYPSRKRRDLDLSSSPCLVNPGRLSPSFSNQEPFSPHESVCTCLYLCVPVCICVSVSVCLYLSVVVGGMLTGGSCDQWLCMSSRGHQLIHTCTAAETFSIQASVRRPHLHVCTVKFSQDASSMGEGLGGGGAGFGQPSAKPKPRLTVQRTNAASSALTGWAAMATRNWWCHTLSS